MMLPGPAAIDFQLQGQAEKGPDQHDEAEDNDVIEGRMDNNGAYDVASYQELETQENRSPQILPAHAIGAKRVALPPNEESARLRGMLQ